MRHAIAIPLIAAALAMGGCANQGGVTTSITPAAITAEVGAVTQDAAAIAKVGCSSVIPTLSSLADIGIAIATKDPDVLADDGFAKEIAGAFCAAVNAKGARRGAKFAPHYGKIALHGRFVNGDRF